MNLGNFGHWALRQALGTSNGNLTIHLVETYGDVLAQVVPALAHIPTGNTDLAKWGVFQVLGPTKGAALWGEIQPLLPHIPQFLSAISGLVSEVHVPPAATRAETVPGGDTLAVGAAMATPDDETTIPPDPIGVEDPVNRVNEIALPPMTVPGQ